MKYKVEGIKTRLIEIDEYDSADIIALRNNPSLNKYLSSTNEITLDMQINWIKKTLSKRIMFILKLLICKIVSLEL